MCIADIFFMNDDYSNAESIGTSEYGIQLQFAYGIHDEQSAFAATSVFSRLLVGLGPACNSTVEG